MKGGMKGRLEGKTPKGKIKSSWVSLWEKVRTTLGVNGPGKIKSGWSR